MKKGAANTDSDLKRVEGMTLDALNAVISRMRYGWEHGGTSQARQAYFKQLVWLESQRERLHEITAPYRRYNR